MTLIEKTLKENTDKLLTKIALDYANNLITVPVIFERLEEELPILITQALQEQDRESRDKTFKDLYSLVNHPKYTSVTEIHCTCLPCLQEEIEAYAKQHNIDLQA